MSRIGTTELLFIFGIVLIVFGPSRLPVIGKMAGKTFGQLKEYADKMSEEIDGIEEVVKDPLASKEEKAEKLPKAESEVELSEEINNSTEETVNVNEEMKVEEVDKKESVDKVEI